MPKDAGIVVETDMFEHREVKPHFINPCCFGEDFAAWLKGRLSAEDGLELSEPIQEDYGWGLHMTQGPDRYWIAISYAGEGPQEEPAQWVVSADPDPGPNLIRGLFGKWPALGPLRTRIREALVGEPAIRVLE